MRDIEQMVILITGATDGLGKRVAGDLAAEGATVLLHGRNQEKGEAALEALQKASGNKRLRYFNADLSSLEEVRQLAGDVAASQSRLDVLVNNAGIGPRAENAPRRESRDGHELFFAVNYLAGYLLTRELLPLLRASAPSRIINVASIGQKPLDFDDVMLERHYDDLQGYCQSKLAQILYTFDLAERLEGSGVTVNCLHPATLMDTNMVHDSDYFPSTMSTTEEGAAALERLILAGDMEGRSGLYFDGQQEARANDQAYDAEARRQLRELSEALVSR